MHAAPPPPPEDDGAILSDLIHGRSRLLILSALSRSGPQPFTELRARLGLTDGTLSVHLERLRRGGMVEMRKEFVERRPRTTVSLTEQGRERFAAYVEDLKRIVPGLD